MTKTSTQRILIVITTLLLLKSCLMYKVFKFDLKDPKTKETTVKMSIKYYEKFSLTCTCNHAHIYIKKLGGEKFIITKMRLEGPNECCEKVEKYGGNWEKRDLNGDFSLFNDYKNNTSIESYFPFSPPEWKMENNSLILTKGFTLPQIIAVEPENIEISKSAFPIEITYLFTIPLAGIILLLEILTFLQYFCVKRDSAVPVYSIVNLMTQNFILILIARRFSQDNTLFFFWVLVVPLIMMIASLVLDNTSDHKKVAVIRISTLIYQLSVHLSLSFYPILIPFFISFGVSLVGLECRFSTLSKSHAWKMGVLQGICCFCVWLYLLYPGTPADVNPSWEFCYYGIGILFGNLLVMGFLIKGSEDVSDRVSLDESFGYNSLGGIGDGRD